ncbi:hypothetical protein MKX03_005660 [Papaver bracteatum]|nr:hypothetical protein MKX03_005660 [Papaver bracteatum]
MASKLFHISPHHAESQIEISLREAFQLLETQLRPPFSLKIPSPSEYLEHIPMPLFQTEAHFSNANFTHLDSIFTDGYTYAVNLILKLVYESYSKLLEPVKPNLIGLHQSCWVEISVMGIFWVCIELLKLCLDKFKILFEDPLILTSALYTYFQLFAYCCRLSGNQKLDNLKKLEIDLCVGMFRKHFQIYLRMGRDLVRLFQDLVYVSEFRAIWKDLLSNLLEFQNSRKLHQESFARKFFCRDEGESAVCDILRFICCTHHPPNEITSLITDNVLNIEPGILLVMNLVPRYIDMTWTLVEFIFYSWNYDVQRKNHTVRGLSTAFRVRKCSIIRRFLLLRVCQTYLHYGLISSKWQEHPNSNNVCGG